MTNGEMFKKLFGFELQGQITCEDIDCEFCPRLGVVGCAKSTDENIIEEWKNMEYRG